MAFFFINEPLWKHVYSYVILMQFLYFNRSFEQSENKIKECYYVFWDDIEFKT